MGPLARGNILLEGAVEGCSAKKLQSSFLVLLMGVLRFLTMSVPAEDTPNRDGTWIASTLTQSPLTRGLPHHRSHVKESVCYFRVVYQTSVPLARLIVQLATTS